MDICEVRLKLQYVIELLDDLWHYQQASAHTCPCNVCTNKQALAKSIIAKALQEVTLIANCIESSNNCTVKDKLPNDLTASLNYGTMQLDQDIESAVLQGSPSRMRQHCPIQVLNYSSGTLPSNISNERKSSVCSDSLKDSGLNTSLSSQSVSPVLGGKYQHMNNNISQLQDSNALNKMSVSDIGELDQAAQNASFTDNFFTNMIDNRVLGHENLSNTRSVCSPSKLLFTTKNNCSDTHKRRTLSFNSQLYSLPGQLSDFHQSSLTLSAFTPQNVMLLPFPFVLSSPNLIEELERYHRCSQQLLRNQNIAERDNAADKMNQSFPDKVHAAPVIPLSSVHASEYMHAPSTLINTEKNNKGSDTAIDSIADAVFEQSPSRGECFHHCRLPPVQEESLQNMRQRTCLSNSPVQNEQPHSLTKKNVDDSASVHSGSISHTDKNASNCFKDGHSGQRLSVKNVQSGSHRKDSSNSGSPMLSSVHQSSHVVTLQTHEHPSQPFSASCKHGQMPSVSCSDQHKLASDAGGEQYCTFSLCAFCDDNHQFDNSVSDFMWRPWETKDMIIGLISVESDEEHKYHKANSDMSLVLTQNKDLRSETTEVSEIARDNAIVENDTHLKILNSSKSTELMTDTSSPEKQCIISCPEAMVIEQNINIIDKNKSVRNMIEEDASLNGSSSGNISLTQKINSTKQNRQDSMVYAADKIIEASIFSQSRKEQLNVGDISAIHKYKRHSIGADARMKFAEEPHTSNERSLKCLSNFAHSPRKNVRLSMYQNPGGSLQVSCDRLDHDKENEDIRCSEELENLKSPSTMSKLDVEQSVFHSQVSSSLDKLPAQTIKNAANHSELAVQICSDSSAVIIPPSHLLLTESKYSLVKQSVVKSSGLLSPPQNVSIIVPDDSSRVQNSTMLTSSKQLMWGAPAVIVESNSIDDHLKQNALETIVQVDKLKTMPKSQSREQFKPVSSKPDTKNSRLKSQSSSKESSPTFYMKSPDTTINQIITCTTEDNNKRDKVVKWSESRKSTELLQETCKGTTSMQESRINLNHTLPVCKILEDEDTNKPKMIDESYEANQSFPKMAKSQQSACTVRDQTVATVCGQGVVTDLHQLSSECSSKPAPRNRRSIFGFSPPDPHKSQKFLEPDSSVTCPVETSLLKIKPLNDLTESGLNNLWSRLDSSDDIGQVPSVQEVLFNCVTSSLCVVDPDRNGKIISVNESFQLLIGFHEKVVDQRLFRFIKFRDSINALGLSLPQSFVLADGHLASVTGKLAYCINASGETIPVSVWTVPFKPQPKLIMCVIDVSVCMQTEIYLNHNGNVLMYSEPLEDILGLTRKGEKGVCQIPDLDFSQVDKPQHTSLQAVDGCSVPVTVTLTGSSDTSQDKEILGCANKNNTSIYPATLSVSINLSGLLIVGSDGVIKFCDKNYFRINLGHCHLEGKYQVSELLSEIMKVSQSSSASSQNSSPVLQDKLNPTRSDMELLDVSRLHAGDGADTCNGNIKKSEFFLPQSCFSSQGLVDLDDSFTGGTDEEESHSSNNESVMEELERQDCLILPVSGVVPYQTSTPCKNGELPINGEPKNILMENGVYAALFLHRNDSFKPVTFKLSHIQTANEALFCLWVYIQPESCKESSDPDDDDDIDSDNDDDNQEHESGDESTCDEEDLRNRLRHLHFDQSINKAGDASLGQLLMEHAGLNQSHNAASDADMLDLEVAIDGSFGKKYMVCEALGQGSFGFVRRARMFSSAETVVVKFIKKSKMFDDAWTADVKNSGRQIPLEVAILRETSSEYIIKLLEFHENESFVQMVMEDFGETDLFDFIDQVEIDEPLACYLFRQILWAVDFLHSKKIIHRDIKDENVVVNRNFHCKLIDFGSATYMLPEGKFFTKFRGTMEYCSPEVYHGANYRGPELDAWALGVTLYTILFRENPFTTSEIPGELDDLPLSVTQDVQTLMLGLLEPDPLKRFTVLQALSCDWLRQIVDLSNYKWCELFGEAPIQSESMFEVGISY